MEEHAVDLVNRLIRTVSRAFYPDEVSMYLLVESWGTHDLPTFPMAILYPIQSRPCSSFLDFQ